MSMTGKIHSVESFGTVDGPGVRFVVFFEGCPMRCLYCHNPDTWASEARTEYTAEALLEKMLRNRSFYRTGGITATGGEPMQQMDFLIELFERAKENGIHTCLDTSGVYFREGGAQQAKIDQLLAVTDLVMLDIKHMDDEVHKKLTGHSNRNILAFASYLKEKKILTRIRHVIVPGYTQDEAELRALGRFLRDFDNLEKVEALPYHALGKAKYENLGIPYPMGDAPQLTDKDAALALSVIQSEMALSVC